MLREIVLALFLTGCVREPSFPELVATARARWERAVCRTPRYLTLSVVETIDNCPGPPPGGSIWYGCYDPSAGSLSVVRKLPPEPGLMLKVLTHEMGHSISPGWHADEDQGIMSPRMSHAKSTITEADIELICQEYDCPCRNPESP